MRVAEPLGLFGTDLLGHTAAPVAVPESIRRIVVSLAAKLLDRCVERVITTSFHFPAVKRIRDAEACLRRVHALETQHVSHAKRPIAHVRITIRTVGVAERIATQPSPELGVVRPVQGQDDAARVLNLVSRKAHIGRICSRHQTRRPHGSNPYRAINAAELSVTSVTLPR